MQSNLEGFFKTRRLSGSELPSAGVSAVTNDAVYNEMQFESASSSRNNLMSLLSGKQEEPVKRKRGRPKKEIVENESAPSTLQENTEPTSMVVTLKVPKERLRSLKASRVDPRDLFSRTTATKRKLMVAFKLQPSKLKNITEGPALVPSSDDEIEHISIQEVLTDDDDVTPTMRIGDIIGTKRQSGDIEIIAERSDVTAPQFKSKVSAQSALQSFKERQAAKQSAQQLPVAGDTAVTTSLSSNSFFANVAERAAVAKLMKDKGLHKPMNPPLLKSTDFHIYEEDDFWLRRKLAIPLKADISIPDEYPGLEHRFGPLLAPQVIKAESVHRSTRPTAGDMEIYRMINDKIDQIGGNSRLTELFSLSVDPEFQALRAQNQTLYCNLFRPKSHHSLLVPSKKIEKLTSWFKTNFESLPKKKPNRSHLFKKNQEDAEDYYMDSFIVNDFADNGKSGQDDNEAERDTELPILILTGDHGIGKSAAIEAILRDLNAYAYDLDSSTLDKKEVREIAVHQKYDKHLKQDSCIVFDEIPADEENFFTILRGLLMITRKPVVMTLSHSDLPRLPHWLGQGETFEFKKVNEALMVKYLSIMALVMNCALSDGILTELVRKCNFDLRRCINELQLLIMGSEDLKGELSIIDKKVDNTFSCSADGSASSIEEMMRDHHRHSLEFDLDEEIVKLDADTEPNILSYDEFQTEMYTTTTGFLNSRLSTKFSRRLMNRTTEFSSRTYNLDTSRGWSKFRLELYEFTRQMARADAGRDEHSRLFQNDPQPLLQQVYNHIT